MSINASIEVRTEPECECADWHYAQDGTHAAECPRHGF